jgi:hypothetical protein
VTTSARTCGAPSAPTIIKSEPAEWVSTMTPS